jgi:hypothetical protein
LLLLLRRGLLLLVLLRVNSSDGSGEQEQHGCT